MANRKKVKTRSKGAERVLVLQAGNRKDMQALYCKTGQDPTEILQTYTVERRLHHFLLETSTSKFWMARVVWPCWALSLDSLDETKTNLSEPERCTTRFFGMQLTWSAVAPHPLKCRWCGSHPLNHGVWKLKKGNTNYQPGIQHKSFTMFDLLVLSRKWGNDPQ